MKVTLDWLKDFVDIDVDASTLADKLVGAGFEVEEIIDLGEAMKNVVLGKIVSLSAHPDADKLQICAVDVGDKVLQIVTGANNIAVGDLVPVAKDNSLLPTGTVIKKGKLRGVVSEGMLCSGGELKLTEADYVGAEAYGILIMNDEKYPLGTDMNVILGNDDVVLDVGITANRSDCNSVLGIAREVAAVLKKPLRIPRIGYDESEKKIDDFVAVDVEATDLCPHYMAGAVYDIRIAPSPWIIRKRLKAVGLRPINNIVDITNYVLIEIGQPMHAFDKRELHSGKIVVRRAAVGESIVALDGKNYVFDGSEAVICDDINPRAVAGIMGGLDSGIKNDTCEVVFESARFTRDNIRRTSRKLNLRSDSSFRYERGVDTDCQYLGLDRALTLIAQYGFGKIAKGKRDIGGQDASAARVVAPISKIDSILGISVPPCEMVEILNGLQIVTRVEGDNLLCDVPRYREDIENANDLAEEIIRMYGYDKIVDTLMDAGRQTMGGKSDALKCVDAVKLIAVERGMSETLNYSFTTPKCFDVLALPEDADLRVVMQLINPLGEDVSIMRTTLAYSMISALASNYLKSVNDVALFEVASVFLPKDGATDVQPNEVLHMSFGTYGKNKDFYSLKNDVSMVVDYFGVKAEYAPTALSFLHRGRGADITLGGSVVGYIGQADPKVATKFDVSEPMYIAELNLDALIAARSDKYVFEPITKYPPIERDIAIVVDESVGASAILDCVKRAGGKLLRDCFVFDIYRSEAIGVDKKSVAVGMEFRAADRTLIDEEVSSKADKILGKLSSELGAQLR